MKKVFLLFLLTTVVSFIGQVYCQTATSIQSPTDSKDWVITSGYSGPASASQIILNGQDGVGGDVDIKAGGGSGGYGKIILQSQQKILLNYGATNNSSVRVGIGRIDPVEALHINGNIRGSLAGGALKINTDYGWLELGPQTSSTSADIKTGNTNFLFNKAIYSTTGQFSSNSTTNLFLQTNGTTRMTLKSDGNIGAGCDPGTTTFKIYKTELPIFELSDLSSYLQIGVARYDGNFAYGSKAGDIVFRNLGGRTANHQGMVFYLPNGNNDGNSSIKFGDDYNQLWMGIFNDRKVRIDGTLFATEIIVKTDVWSDYVFEKDYNLMPLNEIEAFIEENKHLPDVPTANEVIEKGINVAELNAVLLKKVEELTLYIIEQDKQIDELIKLNSEISKRIEKIENQKSKISVR